MGLYYIYYFATCSFTQLLTYLTKRSSSYTNHYHLKNSIKKDKKGSTDSKVSVLPKYLKTGDSEKLIWDKFQKGTNVHIMK